jgi:hypothetical protein
MRKLVLESCSRMTIAACTNWVSNPYPSGPTPTWKPFRTLSVDSVVRVREPVFDDGEIQSNSETSTQLF